MNQIRDLLSSSVSAMSTTSITSSFLSQQTGDEKKEKGRYLLCLDVDGVIFSRSEEANNRLVYLNGSLMRLVASLVKISKVKLILITSRGEAVKNKLFTELLEIGLEISKEDIYCVKVKQEEIGKGSSFSKAEVLKEYFINYYQEIFVVDDDLGFIEPIDSLNDKLIRDWPKIYTMQAKNDFNYFYFIIAFLVCASLTNNENSKDHEVAVALENLKQVKQTIAYIKTFCAQLPPEARVATGIQSILKLFRYYDSNEIQIFQKSANFYNLGLLFCISNIAHQRLNDCNCKKFLSCICCYFGYFFSRNSMVQSLYERLNFDIHEIVVYGKNKHHLNLILLNILLQQYLFLTPPKKYGLKDISEEEVKPLSAQEVKRENVAYPSILEQESNEITATPSKS